MPLSKIRFHVMSASSQDTGHSASQLSLQQSKPIGWKSSRYCVYPQEILIKLDYRAHVGKIQILSHPFLISSRIEVQVGDTYDNNPTFISSSMDSVRFKSLGYLELTDNEKVNRNISELKSVHTDVDGLYIKFVLHKNYYNQRNPYNQIGLMAINVVGEEITAIELDDSREHKIHPIIEQPNNNKSIQPVKSSTVEAPLMDAFQDPEVISIIRRLTKKKQDAVANEKYVEAGELKNVINELNEVGRELGRMEVDKLKAVEKEDYEAAESLREEMNEFRIEAYERLKLLNFEGIKQILEKHLKKKDKNQVNNEQSSEHIAPPIQSTNTGATEHQSNITPPQQCEQPMNEEIEALPSNRVIMKARPSGSNAYDEKILPAVARRIAEGGVEEPPRDDPPSRTPTDEQLQQPTTKPLKRQQQKPKPRPTRQPKIPVSNYTARRAEVKDTGEFIDLTEQEKEEAALALQRLPIAQRKFSDLVVDAFGISVAALVYSNNWLTREKGVVAVTGLVHQSTDRDVASLLLRASAVVIKLAISDRVPSLLNSGLQLMKTILGKFLEKHSVREVEIVSFVEDILPTLIQRTSDGPPRQVDMLKSFVIEVSQYPRVAPLNVVPRRCVEPPLTPNVPSRLALNRAQLVLELYLIHGLTTGGLTLDNIMKFAVSALSHPHSPDVRTKGEEIIVAVYRDVGPPVRGYLPTPNSPRVKTSVLYRTLLDALQQIDNSVNTARPQTQDKLSVPNTARSIEAQVENEDITSKMYDDQFKDELRSLHEIQTRRTTLPRFQDARKMCVFCGTQNENFDEYALDRHYYFNCPMLIKCECCNQIVETSELTKHLLVECDDRTEYELCNRCTEAIPKSLYKNHTTGRLCTKAAVKRLRCPLCHVDFGGPPSAKNSTEKQWRAHLMGRGSDTCSSNPRRVGMGTFRSVASPRVGQGVGGRTYRQSEATVAPPASNRSY